MQKYATILFSVAMLGLGAIAHAADVDVKCEKRSSPPRSRVSVDVRNAAPGIYAAVIASGTNGAVAAPKATIGDEVEFDFDSNRADVRRGATEISSTFIAGDQVSAKVLNAAGAVVAEGRAFCRIR